MYHFILPDQLTDPVEDWQFEQFEQEFSLHLPETLKDYYHHHNGALIAPVTLATDHGRISIVRILPLFTGSMSADHIMEIYQPSGRLPWGFFPFALSEEGDDFFLDCETGAIHLISLDSPRPGKICFENIDSFFQAMSENAPALPEH